MRISLCLLFLLGFALAHAQPDAAAKRRADQYFALQKYPEALAEYLTAHETAPADLSLKQKIGICYFETNKVGEAQRFLNYALENSKSPDPEVVLYLGYCAHSQLRFEEAIRLYKDYLRLIDARNPTREGVKDDIRRCAYGLRTAGKKTGILVENMGPNVNSTGDDFGPVLSPNFDSRIYFSTAREGVTGGLRNADGKEDPTSGDYCADMFASSLSGGAWGPAGPLSLLLNSPRHDVVLDFSEKGSRLYYYKGYNLYSGEIYVDTFRNRPEDRSLFSQIFSGPMDGRIGDGTPNFFRDSILLFSSRREGGFGGLDLYITIFSNGYWSQPENLGPTINTPYDETSPFLAKDGRTLYFSSNFSQRSIGGYDIFRTYYTDATESWSEPENLGIPVNSTEDDLHFKLSRDGLKGYFSSARKEGLGKRDLYTAYFREPRQEQSRTSTPLVFSQVSDYKLLYSRESGDPSTIYPEDRIEKYFLDPLFYETDGEVITGRNMRTLKLIGSLMLDYPQLRLVLTCHTDGADPEDTDHFFAIKRAESVAEFLASNGVPAGRIQLKAVGNNYPIANNQINGQPNPTGRGLNRRIDIEFLNAQGLPLRVRVKEPVVTGAMLNPAYGLYTASVQGLTYRVEIAQSPQKYSGDLFLRYPHNLIEKNADSGLYLYMVGLYKTLGSAEQLRQDLLINGAPQAKIVAYIDGQRISPAEARNYRSEYPDLEDYIRQ